MVTTALEPIQGPELRQESVQSLLVALFKLAEAKLASNGKLVFFAPAPFDEPGKGDCSSFIPPIPPGFELRCRLQQEFRDERLSTWFSRTLVVLERRSADAG